MYFVYILQSIKNNKRYIGFTNNLIIRLALHNSGKSQFTKGHAPFKIVYTKEFDNKTEALVYEKFLKRQKGGVVIKNLLKRAKDV